MVNAAYLPETGVFPLLPAAESTEWEVVFQEVQGFCETFPVLPPFGCPSLDIF